MASAKASQVPLIPAAACRSLLSFEILGSASAQFGLPIHGGHDFNLLLHLRAAVASIGFRFLFALGDPIPIVAPKVTMFRAAARSTPRALRHPCVASASRPRFASTAPADKGYTWKGSAARWGLAIGALYWYNTSPLFAEELPCTSSHPHIKEAPTGSNKPPSPPQHDSPPSHHTSPSQTFPPSMR